jgi:hypothetical protein
VKFGLMRDSGRERRGRQEVESDVLRRNEERGHSSWQSGRGKGQVLIKQASVQGEEPPDRQGHPVRCCPSFRRVPFQPKYHASGELTGYIVF